MITQELSFCDVPCGAGGLSLGFAEAGYRQILGVDKDELRCRTYAHNRLGDVVVARVQDLDMLPAHDVLLAGIPCQPYSQLRWLVFHRLGGRLPEKWLDTTITGEIERLIERNHPQAFLAENVKGAPIPRPAGYHITPLLVDARWLGMVQPRKRRLTFGFREDIAGPMPPPFYPFAGTESAIAHSVLADKRAVPVARLAGGRPKTVTTPPINNDPAKKRRPIKVGTVFAGHGPLRRSWAENGRDESGARYLQGFPDWFVFKGNQDQRLGQIADAVPVPMARWAAATLRDWLLESEQR